MSNVPKLRFKEFSEEWESKKLGDICEIIMGQSPSSSCYNENNIGLPLIQGKADIKDRKTLPRIYTSDITKICDVGDVIMSVRAPVGYISKSSQKSCIGRGVCGIKAKQNREFIYQFLIGYEDKWDKISQGSTFESINRNDIDNTKISIPSLQEQEKIAFFLSLIDDKINLQSEKVKYLKDYKKGLMQKIFSRKLRFKDENGNDYPDWEEKKLGEIGTTYTGLSGKNKDDFGIGKSKYITYKNVFTNIIAKKNDVELVNIKESENQNRVLKGDLFFTTSSETPIEVGFVSYWNYDEEDLYLNSFCFGYRILDSNVYLPQFIAYLLRSDFYRKNISILGQGSTRYNISKTELMNMNINLPCLDEQIKIVNLLTVIDEKIEKEQEKLNSLTEYKKGLLQQMFV